MNNIYFASNGCVSADAVGTPCADHRAPLAERARAWFATLSRGLARDKRKRDIAAAYRDLGTNARIDLGIDRRRA